MLSSDPLCFKPDSTLGVAGFMSAYMQHNVVIANAPGTGVADDKSIYPYVDKMIHFYLGEKHILKNVPTYQCRKQHDLDYVWRNMEQLVVKEAQGSGGYGMSDWPASISTRSEIYLKIKSLQHRIYILPNRHWICLLAPLYVRQVLQNVILIFDRLY